MKPKIIGITGPLGSAEKDVIPFNKYRLSYANSIVKHCKGCVPLFLPSIMDEIENYLNVCDGFIFSGGNGNVDPSLFGDTNNKSGILNIDKSGRVEFEMELMRQAIALDKSVLAICLGLQILNVIFCGSIKPTPITNVAHQGDGTIKDTTTIFHDVNIFSGTKLMEIVKSDRISVNSAHGYCINKIGNGLNVCANTDDGVIEALEMSKKKFVLGLQWHPEVLLDNNNSASIFKAFAHT